MLSMLTYGHLGTAGRETASDLDPGIFSLIARVVRSWRGAQLERHEQAITTFIEATGGQLSDDVERRIGAGLASGRF